MEISENNHNEAIKHLTKAKSLTKETNLNLLFGLVNSYIALRNIKNIVNQNFEGEYILIFPFCSPQLSHKKWPHFNELIKIIKFKPPKATAY